MSRQAATAERKKKRKPRVRRIPTPSARPAEDDPALSDERLRRASTVATALGVLTLAAALGLAFFSPRAHAALGQGGSLALRVAGGGLVIAGWVIGRARRR